MDHAKEKALNLIEERIERMRTINDLDLLGDLDMRFLGFMEALQDVDLISHDEAESFHQKASTVVSVRREELHASRRQN